MPSSVSGDGDLHVETTAAAGNGAGTRVEGVAISSSIRTLRSAG
ncbi:hypothetical protein Ae717Ps2_7219c [Pseudonocardia sp. Ae717_Ps2]|nr:hypothetical protein Ae717Ps2_7219c [Pseudonocardia sp. Ae717_Ps2]